MMYVIHYHWNELQAFVADDPMAGLMEAAHRLGLTEYEIAPLRHKSRRLVLRDRDGNLKAIPVKTVNPIA